VSPPASSPFGLVSRIAVLLVFVLPVLAEISAVEPEPVAAESAELTVMVYNIQSGFARDRTWDLRRTADVIAAQNPDIVVLNEVSRGWLVTASSDQLVWLSRELDMPFVWGPASDDDLWGNAILSRVPLDQTDTRKFASTQNLKRSVAGIELTVNGTSFWVFGTHLDDPRGAGEARMEQLRELISFQDGRGPGIIMGDFNAEPEDDVLQELLALGYRDPVGAALPDVTTSQDDRRIDYILVSEGIEVLDVRVPDVAASDHKPVVARIRVGD
jgi:endonuclease/exonuclease/phosphatase family metal-dependent hydrolase